MEYPPTYKTMVIRSSPSTKPQNRSPKKLDGGQGFELNKEGFSRQEGGWVWICDGN